MKQLTVGDLRTALRDKITHHLEFIDKFGTGIPSEARP